MSDVHVLFLKKALADREHLHRLVDDGVLRASALTLSGSHYGIGVGTYSRVAAPVSGDAVPPGEEAPTLESARRAICDDGSEPPCDGLYMLPLRGVPSGLEPREFIVFVLLELRRGGVRRWRELVRELPSAEGVDEAVALTFGRSGVDAVVELVADDVVALGERLLEYTDSELVVSFDVLHTSASRTRGFGGLAPVSSA